MTGANGIAVCLNCDTWNLARSFGKLPMYVNIFLELFLSVFPRHPVHHTQTGDIANEIHLPTYRREWWDKGKQIRNVDNHNPRVFSGKINIYD